MPKTRNLKSENFYLNLHIIIMRIQKSKINVMNKKLFKLFASLFLFSLIIGSCSSEPDQIKLDKDTLVFETEGGSQNVAVSSNGTWTISGEADWFTVSPRNGERNATITVTVSENQSLEPRNVVLIFSRGTQTTSLNITQKARIHEGIIINGIRWATGNVVMPSTFAENPEESGMFYQWNRRVAWSTTGNVSGWNSNIPIGNVWDRANSPCPTGWRAPTLSEFQALTDINNVTSEWININGVFGRKFTDRSSGNTLFLPAIGRRNDTNGALSMAGSSGFYWSNTFSNTISAFILYFNSDNIHIGDITSSRALGMSVRCVAE